MRIRLRHEVVKTNKNIMRMGSLGFLRMFKDFNGFRKHFLRFLGRVDGLCAGGGVCALTESLMLGLMRPYAPAPTRTRTHPYAPASKEK